MQRSTRVAAAAAALATICLTLGAAQSASAAEPLGGCGASNELLTVEDAAAFVDLRPYMTEGQTEQEAIAYLVTEIGPAVDENGDGWVCARHLATNKQRDAFWGFPDYVVTRIGDNKASFGRL